jgi:hypothetical protein
MVEGLEKAKSFYGTAKELQTLVCGQDAALLAQALVSVGVEPEALIHACATSADGLVVGKDAINTLIDVYTTLNDAVGQ